MTDSILLLACSWTTTSKAGDQVRKQKLNAVQALFLWVCIGLVIYAIVGWIIIGIAAGQMY
jgi:hypothetical protein